MSNIAIARVSVLDLDNSVRFSQAYSRAAEEKAGSKSYRQAKAHVTKLRSSRYSGGSNSVVIVSLFTMSKVSFKTGVQSDG